MNYLLEKTRDTDRMLDSSESVTRLRKPYRGCALISIKTDTITVVR